MLMKNRRFVACFLILILLSGLLTGCGRRQMPEEPAQPTEPTPGVHEPEVQQPTEPTEPESEQPAATPVYPEEPSDRNALPTAASSYDEIYDAYFHVQAEHEAFAFFEESFMTADIAEYNSDTVFFGDPDYTKAIPQKPGVLRGALSVTDGRRIYLVSGSDLIVLEADGAQTRELCRSYLMEPTADGYSGSETAIAIYLSGASVSVITSEYRTPADPFEAPSELVRVKRFDFSDPQAPARISEFSQSGRYMDSFAVGGRLYVISSAGVWDPDPEHPESFVPSVSENGNASLLPPDSVYLSAGLDSADYTVLSAFDLQSGTRLQTKALTGYYSYYEPFDGQLCLARTGSTHRVSQPFAEAQYTVTEVETSASTWIVSFSADETLFVRNAACFPGILRSRASIDALDGILRLGLSCRKTVGRFYLDETYGFKNYLDCGQEVSTGISLLDASLSELKTYSEPDTAYYSVRFSGNAAYLTGFESLAPVSFIDLTAKTLAAAALEPEKSFPHTLHAVSDSIQLGLGAGENGIGLSITLYDVSDGLRLLDRETTDAVYGVAAFAPDTVCIFPESETACIPSECDYLLFSLEDGTIRQEAVLPVGYVSAQESVFKIGDCMYFCNEAFVRVYDAAYQELQTIEFAFG